MPHVPWKVITATATGDITTKALAIKHLRLVSTGAATAQIFHGSAASAVPELAFLKTTAEKLTDDLPFGDDHLDIKVIGDVGLRVVIVGTATLYAYTK